LDIFRNRAKPTDDLKQKIISLLESAHMLAIDLEEGAFTLLIERAIDEARSDLFPPKQAPYFHG
jgi:hypothetical protein